MKWLNRLRIIIVPTNIIITIKISIIKSWKNKNSSIIKELLFWRLSWFQVIIMISLIKKNPLLNIISGSLVDLPSPVNLNSMWNFGSLLGLCLIVQVLRGLFLALHYSGNSIISFEVVINNHLDVNFNWLLRIRHANGARIFFFCIYFHISRGLYFSSYYFYETWRVGVILLLLVIASAFLGYVLPWGQMSFWGATVITRIFSAIPYFGGMIVYWLWGGFSVDNPTLTRFFGLHFLLPFVVLGLTLVHLLYLHQTGSNNPLGIDSNRLKLSFYHYFLIKDFLGFIFFFLILGFLLFFAPWILGDPENFIEANPLVTPIHIQPEWYFLFAYAILRSIPNKLGGVLALFAAVLILFYPLVLRGRKFQRLTFYPIRKFYFWFLVNIFILLTWIGARPVEEPYVLIGQILTVFYFLYFLSFNVLIKIFDKVLV